MIKLGKTANINTVSYAGYFNSMLKKSIYLEPSQFEAMFVSVAHSEDDIKIL